MTSKGKGMAGHQSTKMEKDEWLTPPEIFNSLGHFDLDPCAPVVRPWDTAANHYTIQDDGLKKDWFGRVWLNPPYGKYAGKWLKKMVEHGDGIALVFARTETKMFFNHVWGKADGIFFFKGRLVFHHVTGEPAKNNGGAPSVLIGYGRTNAEILKNSGLEGFYVDLKG